MPHASFVILLSLVAVCLALAHILGRPVLGHKISNIKACVPIRTRTNDNRYAQFKTAQKILDKEMMSKEAQLSSSKAKQSVLDFTSLGKGTVTGEMKIVADIPCAGTSAL